MKALKYKISWSQFHKFRIANHSRTPATFHSKDYFSGIFLISFSENKYAQIILFLGETVICDCSDYFSVCFM